MEIHHISPAHLTIDRVEEILEKKMHLALSEEAKTRIIKCREYLDEK